MAAPEPVPTPDPVPAPDPASSAGRKPPAAERLAELLETLAPQDRMDIVAFLLGSRRPWTFGLAPTGALSPTGQILSQFVEQRFARTVPPGEDTQLVTIRLPSDRHAQLRTWCESHGFTMAAVIRGLVERFLETRGGSASPGGTTDD